MIETLEKWMNAGLGALNMTRQRAEKIFDECVQRGEAQKEQRSEFVKDVMDTTDRARKDVEKLVSRQVDRMVKKMNVATRDDLARLEAKLDQLLKQD